MTFHYGLKSIEEAKDLALKVALNTCVGDPKLLTNLLLETACAETYCGRLKDPTPTSAGAGLTQVDVGTFEWLKSKYKGRLIASKIKQNLNVDISRVQYADLREDPLLAFIFCRLRYLCVPSSIPPTLEKRAELWKKYYNTKYGKGTVKGYILKAEFYLK